jgi:hypothetical protein
MNNLMHSIQRNRVSLLMIFACVFGSFLGLAQTPPTLYGQINMLKVDAGKEREFLSFMRETVKPVHMLRRQKGQIVLWILFKVHFTGANDEYNYVAVHYYPTWAKTEEGYVLQDLFKEVNPKADAVALGAKLRELGTLVRTHLFYRSHAVEPQTPVPSKYVRLDYMKVKPGKNADYVRAETEDWMPFHQTLVNEGQSTGWGLWQLVFPGGSDSPYDYVTSNRYSTYEQVMATDYEKTFRKASPSKDINKIFEKTTGARDLVKSELWEVVDMLQ